MSRALCLKCRTLLESKTRHDFAACGCDNQSFIDGGSDYLRVGGVDPDAILILEGSELAGATTSRPIAWLPQGLCDAMLRALRRKGERAYAAGKEAEKMNAMSIPMDFPNGGL